VTARIIGSAHVPPGGQSAELTRGVVRLVQETEHTWLKQGDPASAMLPWMPFQPAEFCSILFECVPEMKGSRFLDVGCGPGTKLLLARHFFGLRPDGIEVNPELAAVARVYAGLLHTGDALLAPDGFYADYDLIWMYRPFRDRQLEQQLEDRVMAEMKPGAILAGAHWETCPADRRWIPVFDDWEIRRGAWMKPGR
jgi:SAM-dependent methyltransferase